MKTVKIKDLISNRSYPDAGKELFIMIKKAMESDELVSIDMDEVASVPTLFMNTSFGEAFIYFGIDKTKNVLRFKNIKKSQVERIRKYFNDSELMRLPKEKSD